VTSISKMQDTKSQLVVPAE